MGFKATKGKWILDEEEYFKNEFGTEVFVISKEDKTEVQMADIYGNKANALLMSKAPEMLEMLNKIVKNYKIGNEDNFIMANLIDKSEQLIKEATELN